MLRLNHMLESDLTAEHDFLVQRTRSPQRLRLSRFLVQRIRSPQAKRRTNWFIRAIASTFRSTRLNERGNIVLSLAVIVTLSTIMVAVIGRATSAMTNTVTLENISLARYAAEAGISSALAAIDESLVGDSAPSSLNGYGVLSSAGYDWSATLNPDSSWSIISHGTSGVEAISISADANRTSGFMEAIRVNHGTNLSNSSLRLWSIDSRISPTVETFDAIIASNESLQLSGLAGGDKQVLHTPLGECIGSGCDNVSFERGPTTYLDPALPDTFQPCPAAGSFPSIIDGKYGIPFACNNDISFASGVSSVINGPAVIHVGDTFDVSIPPGASLNWLNNAGALQLLKAGNGNVTIGDITSSPRFFGVLYAPKANVIAPGPNIQLGGALVCDRLITAPNAGGQFVYDQAAKSLPQGVWRISNWRQLPA